MNDSTISRKFKTLHLKLSWFMYSEENCWIIWPIFMTIYFVSHCDPLHSYQMKAILLTSFTFASFPIFNFIFVKSNSDRHGNWFPHKYSTNNNSVFVYIFGWVYAKIFLKDILIIMFQRSIAKDFCAQTYIEEFVEHSKN